jgi:inorganic pyrophosphatase
MDSKQFLGKIVTVTVERPIGSTHPKHANIIYPVNYGYIEHTVSGDGEPMDAYILGVEEEMAEFEGKVHAIIHRIDEDDDKLIVAPEEMQLTEDDILEATYFQEQFFEIEIIR